jgi:hypothetical protein
LLAGTLWSIETGREVFIYDPATNHVMEWSAWRQVQPVTLQLSQLTRDVRYHCGAAAVV